MKNNVKIIFEPITKSMLIEGNIMMIDKIRKKIILALKQLKDQTISTTEN
jgi:hypothetical protein